MLTEILLMLCPDAEFTVSKDENGDEYISEWLDSNKVPKPSKTKIKNAYKKYETDLLKQQDRLNGKIKAFEDIVNLKVDTKIGTWNANEASQNRILIAIMTMTDSEKIEWLMADNSIVEVSKNDLLEALKKARITSSKIWLAPDKSK